MSIWRNRLALTIAQALVVPAALLAAGALPSCKATADPLPDPPAHPEVVVADFFANGQPTAACSGTLIAPRVVITAAHCAEGSTAARVKAPRADGQSSRVAQWMTYDWVPGDGAQHAAAHDVAVLILEDGIAVPRYAAIRKEACPGCKAVPVGRRAQKLAVGKAVRLSKTSPEGHPFEWFVAQSSQGAGGPMFRAGVKRPLLLGVTIGRGVESGGSYVARLDDPDLQRWITSVVRSTPGMPSTGNGVSTSQYGIDEEGDFPDDGSSSGGDDTSTGGDDDSSTTGGDDTSTTGGDDTSTTGGDDTSTTGGDDTSTTGGDDTSTTGGDDTSTTGGDDTSTTGGDDTSTTGGDDTSTTGGDDTSTTGGDEATTSGGEGEQPPEAPSNEPIEPGGMSPTADPATAPEGYTAEPMVVRSGGDEVTQCNASGTSCVSLAPHEDTLAQSAVVLGDALSAKGANYFAAHGNPGVVWANDPDTMRSLAADAEANNKAMIVGSCYGGVKGPNGTTAIGDLAAESGANPGRVWGCTGLSAPAGDQALCGGDWVDANGKPVRREDREFFGLQSCAVKKSGNDFNWSKCSYDLSGNP